MLTEPRGSSIEVEMLRDRNGLTKLGYIATPRPGSLAHPDRDRHNQCSRFPVKVDDARCEFADRRLALSPDLSFGKNRYHVALIQRRQQATDLLRVKAVIVIFRWQLNRTFEPVDDPDQWHEPVQPP